jgi:hypothetical protein
VDCSSGSILFQNDLSIGELQISAPPTASATSTLESDTILR